VYVSQGTLHNVAGVPMPRFDTKVDGRVRGGQEDWVSWKWLVDVRVTSESKLRLDVLQQVIEFRGEVNRASGGQSKMKVTLRVQRTAVSAGRREQKMRVWEGEMGEKSKGE